MYEGKHQRARSLVAAELRADEILFRYPARGRHARQDDGPLAHGIYNPRTGKVELTPEGKAEIARQARADAAKRREGKPASFRRAPGREDKTDTPEWAQRLAERGCAPGCDYYVTGYHAKRGGRVLCEIGAPW